MGKLIKSKHIGKNLRVNLYYFRDGYRIYAFRRDNNQGVDSWRESAAADYPIHDKAQALKTLNEYTKGSVLLIHPVLRDEGTSMSPRYSYKI